MDGDGGCANEGCRGLRLCHIECPGCPDIIRCHGGHTVDGDETSAGCKNDACRGVDVCVLACAGCPDMAAQWKEREAGEAVVDGDAGKFQCESCWALMKYSGIQTNMCVRVQRMYKRWARVRAYRGRVQARVRHAAESVVAVRIQAFVRGKQSRSAGLIEGLIKLAKGYEKAMDLAEALRLYETAELNLTTKLGEGNNLDDKLLVSTSANVIRLDNAVRVIGGEVDAAVKKARLLREGLEKINDMNREGSSIAGTSLGALWPMLAYRV